MNKIEDRKTIKDVAKEMATEVIVTVEIVKDYCLTVLPVHSNVYFNIDYKIKIRIQSERKILK